MWDVATDGSDILLAGSYSGPIDFGGGALPSSSSGAAFLARLDGTGEHLFSRSFHAVGGTVNGHAVTFDGFGGYVFAGSYSGAFSIDGASLPATPTEDDQWFFVARLDESGKALWSQGAAASAGSGSSRVKDVAMIDGDLVVVGGVSGALDLGGGPLPEHGDLDFFVARMSLDGALVWGRRFGGTGVDSGFLVPDRAGRLLITGSFEDKMPISPGIALGSAGLKDCFVMELDAQSGDVLWAKRFGGAGRDWVLGAAGSVSHEIALVGEFYGTLNWGTASLSAKSSDDAFVARLDGSGNHLWSASYGSGAAQWGAIAYDDAGRLLAGGFVTNEGTLHGLLTAWANGVQVLDLTLASDEYQTLAARPYQGDRFIVSGSFRDTIDVGFGQMVSHGMNDFFVSVWPLP